MEIIMKIGIMTSECDTWISDEELPSLNQADLTWFKEECRLSREDLHRVLARAKEIAQEYKLKPSEIEKLTYDIDGGWYIHFDDDDRESIYREDKSLVRQQADMGKEANMARNIDRELISFVRSLHDVHSDFTGYVNPDQQKRVHRWMDAVLPPPDDSPGDVYF
jgi:hypothetical protein